MIAAGSYGRVLSAVQRRAQDRTQLNGWQYVQGG